MHLGDTAFEDRLAALAGGQPAEEAEGGESLEAEAANVLEVVCLGLCGELCGVAGAGLWGGVEGGVAGGGDERLAVWLPWPAAVFQGERLRGVAGSE